MLPSSRLESAWSGVLLLSIFTPWAIADELPQGRYRVRAREVVRTVAATENDVEKSKVDSAAEKRWSELKARHAAKAAAPAQLPPKPIPETAVPSAPDQPAKLTAADSSAEQEAWFDEPESAAPTPILRKTEAAPQEAKTESVPLRGAAEDQPWIFGLVPGEKESGESAPKTAMRNIERAEPEAQEQAVPPAATTDAGQPAKMRPPRRPRKIDEITPRYDLALDQDIRQFAAEQAQQYNVHFQRESFPQRSFTGVVYNWEAANFHYLPLYFQDPQLERYGHTYPCYLQPAASIARFGVQLIGMPYQMAIKPPCYPEYPLGWYRPGDVAPKLCYQIPWNTKAALVEAGVITGAFFIIP